MLALVCVLVKIAHNYVIVTIKNDDVILMTVVGCSDLPEDRSSVLLLGVTKLQTSPVPTRRPSSFHVAVDSDQSNHINSGQSTRSSCYPRIIINHNSQRCNANNIVTNQKLSSSSSDDVFNDKLAINGDSPTTNGKITSVFCNSSVEIGHSIMDKSVDSIGTCSLDMDASVDVPGRNAA